MEVNILGTAQDAGYPQIGCKAVCCEMAWKDSSLVRLPSCISLSNSHTQRYWLFDVTPDIKKQIQMLDPGKCQLAGVFITHAHIGHYMGLINFGLEVMNLDKIPVYVMPRMKSFLKNNSIINQLLINDNIDLIELSDNKYIDVEDVKVKPFYVPHRNELSETVGFKIKGNSKSIIYLPDIDSWDGWEDNLFSLIYSNDILLLDGTFYSKIELKTRDISKVPHPSIIDTMRTLSHLDKELKKKVHFIHFNHTNNAIRHNTAEYNNVIDNGFLLSEENQVYTIS